ncbi:Hypothetical predicted protein [Podarcis lilfordi]|uniref:Uncharacterized protein n=1 Tax=Podarcis lilfordi TaxID=74358 RepID=A0AA35L1J4_9SAUR|nr:Hypothetical predicted protein [Podarcis lilfordi]
MLRLPKRRAAYGGQRVQKSKPAPCLPWPLQAASRPVGRIHQLPIWNNGLEMYVILLAKYTVIPVSSRAELPELADQKEHQGFSEI